MRISDWSSDVCSSDLGKAAADTFRPKPKGYVAREITELKVGEALVSVLMADGAPSPVERTLVKPPCSRCGPLEAKERAIIQSISPVAGKYDTAVDRESAEELLAAKAEQAQAAAVEAKAKDERSEEHTSELQSLMRNSYAVFC